MKSRPVRWQEAATAAEAALQELAALQEEYQEWRDNLPENMDDSPTAERLDEVLDLDVNGALQTVEEASLMELPRGFGRD